MEKEIECDSPISTTCRDKDDKSCDTSTEELTTPSNANSMNAAAGGEGEGGAEGAQYDDGRNTPTSSQFSIDNNNITAFASSPHHQQQQRPITNTATANETPMDDNYYPTYPANNTATYSRYDTRSSASSGLLEEEEEDHHESSNSNIETDDDEEKEFENDDDDLDTNYTIANVSSGTSRGSNILELDYDDEELLLDSNSNEHQQHQQEQPYRPSHQHHRHRSVSAPSLLETSERTDDGNTNTTNTNNNTTTILQQQQQQQQQQGEDGTVSWDGDCTIKPSRGYSSHSYYGSSSGNNCTNEASAVHYTPSFGFKYSGLNNSNKNNEAIPTSTSSFKSSGSGIESSCKKHPPSYKQPPTTPTTTPTNQSIIPLHTLPIDALHTTSSYCTPQDWLSVTSTNKLWKNIGYEIFAKVWRHAGRCMMEVGYAWARGEHADARELASLYISKGVPIYPTPRGHAYHTIAWRMGLELNTMNNNGEDEEDDDEGNATAAAGGENDNGNDNDAQVPPLNPETILGEEAFIAPNNNNNNEGNNVGAPPPPPLRRNNNVEEEDGDDDDDNNVNTDAFYTYRYVDEAESDQSDSFLFSRNHATYVEEKALFWKQKKGIEVDPPPSQSRGALFPRRRFSFGGNNDHLSFGGNDLLTRDIATARRGVPLIPPPLPPPQAPTWQEDDVVRAAPQAADNAPNLEREVTIERPPPGMEAATARPQSALPGPRPSNENAAATAYSTIPSALSSTPRYARRSSFSGGSSPNNSFTSPPILSARNPSTPNLFSFHQTSVCPPSTCPPQPPAAAATKMSLRIHKHLADQHFFGSPSVNDENGSMNAGKMSMNADFFHPTWEGRHGVTVGCSSLGNASSMSNRWEGNSWGTTIDDVDRSIHNTINAPGNVAAAFVGGNNDVGETIDGRPRVGLEHEGEEEARITPRAVDSNYRAAVRAFVTWTLANAERQRRNSLPNSAGGTRHLSPLSFALNPSLWSSTAPSPASDVHLEVYSSTSANLKSDDDTDRSTSEAVDKMHARCLHYQQRLDNLIKTKFDTFEFQEVLLDFWDEIYPTTAGIHYYNQQSPVPRMSRLSTFLTTPCPKAVGTIQCEIERVTVKNKKRAKRVKGRFFPSYEYRLFIRDTKNENLFPSSRHPPRKDTVLLVAKSKSSKNRNVASNGGGSGGGRGSGVGGRDFATPSALASPANNIAGSSKRGITNYYMCLPQQKDVDSHYMSVNRNNANLSKDAHSGLAVSLQAMQSEDSVEVGRLQSNFIGTEFQIYVPTNPDSLQCPTSEDLHSTAKSDTDKAEDKRVHPIDSSLPVTSSATTTTTGRRRSRRGSGLVRLAQRASLTMSRRGSARNHDAGTSGDPAEESEGPSSRKGSTKKVMRRMSWGSSSNTNKRMNRRAIANNSESYSDDPSGNSAFNSSVQSITDTTVNEVENGAITYTANLLGNRPRIMDVCIPKLTEDGTVCDQWSGEHQENARTADGAMLTMLDRFKTIQQGVENLEDDANSNSDNANGNDGLMIFQNRPPWWNLELGAFVLNFGGRVKVASVKNFQLCERNDQDHIMQFGRIEGRHSFTIDYSHPLTPLQAFAIAISSLQSKISFG